MSGKSPRYPKTTIVRINYIFYRKKQLILFPWVLAGTVVFAGTISDCLIPG